MAYWQVEQQRGDVRSGKLTFGNPVVVAEDALLQHRFGIDVRKLKGLVRAGDNIVVWPSTGPMLRVTRVAAPKKGRRGTANKGRRAVSAPPGTSVRVIPATRGSFSGYEVHLTMADGDKYVSRFVTRRSDADLYATRIRRALARPAGADLTGEKYGLLRLVSRAAKATGARARKGRRAVTETGSFANGVAWTIKPYSGTWIRPATHARTGRPRTAMSKFHGYEIVLRVPGDTPYSKIVKTKAEAHEWLASWK